jgi:uncharacterized protein YhdP
VSKLFIKLLQLIWQLFFSLSLLLYFVVVTKMATPVLNFYSSTTVSPIVNHLLPKGTKFSGIILSWDNLYPFITISDLDISEAKLVSGIEYMSGLSVKVDIYSSIFQRTLVLNKVSMDKIRYVSNKIDFNKVNSAVNSVSNDIKEFSTNSINMPAIIPNSVHVGMIEFEIAKEHFFINNIDLREEDDKKHLSFTMKTKNNFSLQANISSYDNDSIVKSISGLVHLEGKVPSTFEPAIKKLNINGISGSADITFEYSDKNGVKAKINHNLKAKVKHSKDKFITLSNIRGSSNINIRKDFSYKIDGKIKGARTINKTISGFDYSYENNKGEDILSITKINLADSYIMMPMLISNKNKFYKMLTRPGIKGSLSNLNFSWNKENGFNINVAQFELRDFSMPRYSLLPGVDNLNANLDFVGNSGVVELFPNNNIHKEYFTIDDDRIHSSPMQIKSKPVLIKISRDNEFIDLEVDKIDLRYNDFSLSGSGSATLSAEDYPRFNLHLAINDASVDAIKDLLPIKILPKGLNNYLENSLLSGSVSQADIWLDSVNEAEMFDYRYKFTAETNNISLKYEKDWPELNNISASILVQDGSAKVEVNNASSRGVAIDYISLIVPHFKDPILDLSIVVKNLSTAAGLKFLNETPIKHKIEPFNKNGTISGDSKLDLSVKIGIDNGVQVKSLDGNLVLGNNKLIIPKHDLEFDDLNGFVKITKDTMISKDVKAKLDGRIIDVDFSSQGSDFSVNLAGILNANKIISKYLPKKISDNIKGYPGTNVTLKIDDKDNISIKASNYGPGLQLDFPKPLSLAPDSFMPFVFDLNLKKDKFEDYTFSLSSDTRVSWVSKNNRFNISVPNIVFDDWMDIMSGDGSSNIPDIKLNSNHMSYKGINLNNANLGIKFLDNNIKINIKSDSFVGDVDYKKDKVLYGSFSKINLNNSGKKSYKLDESILAGLDYAIRVKDLTYNGKRIKDVNVNLVKSEHGYNIKNTNFILNEDRFNLNGYWEIGAKSKTYLEGSFNTNNLGDFLSLFPDQEYIVGSNGEIKFKVSWPTKPSDISIMKMKGIVVYNLHEGQIMNLGDDVSKGVGIGVLLNILSLQSILDGLSLDSKEVSEGSYPFNSMVGGITFDDGMISTSKTIISGALGTVLARGDLSINSNDCDIYLTILPNITSSIPTIAAIAGGVAAGFIAWTANKIIEQPVSEIAMQVYRVYGNLNSLDIDALDNDNLPEQVLLP